VIVYDTGALVAGERSDRQMWALHDAALRRGIVPTVPAAALAQAWRGGPQARLSQMLRGCSVLAMDEPIARSAGRLCGTAGTSDVIDASVVATAASRRAAIVTSDPADIRELLSATNVDVPIHAV
jgi:predicted nucleic acid-binding protein